MKKIIFALVMMIMSSVMAFSQITVYGGDGKPVKPLSQNYRLDVSEDGDTTFVIFDIPKDEFNRRVFDQMKNHTAIGCEKAPYYWETVNLLAAIHEYYGIKYPDTWGLFESVNDMLDNKRNYILKGLYTSCKGIDFGDYTKYPLTLKIRFEFKE